MNKMKIPTEGDEKKMNTIDIKNYANSISHDRMIPTCSNE